MNESQPSIAGVLHFGFTVHDIELSVDWYSNVLGLELVHRQRGDNPYTRQLVGVENAVLDVAQFTIPGHPAQFSTHVVELIQYVQGGDGRAVDLRVNRVGAAHLALIVTNIEERYAKMTAQGAEFVNPPVLITEGANIGGKACYLKDPDGITIELMQFGRDRAMAVGIESGAVQ